jgi:hypothetical protein
MSSEIVADENGVIVFSGPESCIVCFVVQPRRVSVVPKIYPDGWMDGWTRYYNYTPSLFFFFFPAKFLAPICKREKKKDQHFEKNFNQLKGLHYTTGKLMREKDESK